MTPDEPDNTEVVSRTDTRLGHVQVRGGGRIECCLYDKDRHLTEPGDYSLTTIFSSFDPDAMRDLGQALVMNAETARRLQNDEQEDA